MSRFFQFALNGETPQNALADSAEAFMIELCRSQKGQYDFYRDISVGDSAFFTDMEGNRFSYTVTDIRYEKNAAQSTLQCKDTSLTLFVKNVYAFEYVIIYCDVVH